MFWMASFSCTDGMHLIEFSSHTVQACKRHCQFFWIYVVVIIIHYSKLIIFFIYISVCRQRVGAVTCLTLLLRLIGKEFGL